MVIEAFPPLHESDDHGLLAVGGDLEVASLLLAYRSGIFPWPLHQNMLAWFAPPRRAILRFEKLHISKSLAKELRRGRFEIRFDSNCPEVIRRCRTARNRRTLSGDSQAGTWITPQMRDAYIQLHQCGYCHSAEAYLGGLLAGGLYGVGIGAMFAGESMFYDSPNASKVALVALMRHLASQGAMWIDCQVMTPLFAHFGAEEIPREEFMKMLESAIRRSSVLF